MIRRRESAASSRRHGSRRSRDERGSVFIQFALLVPLLTVFAMGIVEYGLGWKWANDVNAATRDAARTGTSEPAFATADKSILLSIGSTLTTEQINNIQRIVVFKANTSGTVPSGCASLTPSTGTTTAVGVSSSCNVYGKAQVNYVLGNPTDNTKWVNSAGNGCDSSDLDANWCPATRNRNLTTGNFDDLGVYLEIKKPDVTHMGFGQMTIKRTSVFRLEPAFGGS